MLTTQQAAALAADITSNSNFGQSPNTDGAFAIAAIYNAPGDPEYIVWKTRVTRQEVLQNGFDWTRLDNLSVGKARVWNDIFVDGALNAAKPNVRAGIGVGWHCRRSGCSGCCLCSLQAVCHPSGKAACHRNRHDQ